MTDFKDALSYSDDWVDWTGHLRTVRDANPESWPDYSEQIEDRWTEEYEWEKQMAEDLERPIWNRVAWETWKLLELIGPRLAAVAEELHIDSSPFLAVLTCRFFADTPDDFDEKLDETRIIATRISNLARVKLGLLGDHADWNWLFGEESSDNDVTTKRRPGRPSRNKTRDFNIVVDYCVKKLQGREVSYSGQLKKCVESLRRSGKLEEAKAEADKRFREAGT